MPLLRARHLVRLAPRADGDPRAEARVRAPVHDEVEGAARVDASSVDGARVEEGHGWVRKVVLAVLVHPEVARVLLEDDVALRVVLPDDAIVLVGVATLSKHTLKGEVSKANVALVA